MHRSLSTFGRLTAILALGSAALVAQGTQTANVTGEIRDEAKAPIMGATVRLTSPALQGARTSTTDEKGRFSARLLPTGTYTLEVWKNGFQTAKITQKLGIDQNFQPTITLVKTMGSVVEVVASAVGVDKTDAMVAQNYQLDAVDELPTLNRTMETLAALSPGVTDNGVGGRLQIRGALTSGNLFLLDGQNISDATYGTRGVAIIEDSIEEVQVVTGAISAEYGNVDGGVVNSTTRSGSNVFDGQLRYELSNPKWDAVKPYQAQASLVNSLSKTYTTSFGGPIVKDKLWFHFSYFRNNSSTPEFITAGSSDNTAMGAGAPYTYMQDEIRRQIKLTWAATENHTVVASFMNNANSQDPRNYSAGSLNALEHETVTSGFYSVALRSIWTPTITSELRYGQKRETLAAGAKITTVDPIYEDASGLFYNAGIFNFGDGGDHRNNRTFNAKVSLFWDANGAHQTDMGFDFYRGLRAAANMQATNNLIFEVAGIGTNSIPGYVNTPESVWTFVSDTRQAESDTYGLYINDKWSMNKNWSFQLGLRYDNYSAKDTNGGSTVSANGISPRLGLNYDVKGDGVWLVKASWSRYNSGVADQIASQVTNAGNPTETDYNYTGPAGDANGNVPLAVATNMANYTISPANVAYYSNPVVNLRLSSGLKSPHVDEAQVSGAYSFKGTPIGAGFLRVTFVNKEWHDLFDYTQGNSGSVTDAYNQVWDLKVWENSSQAQRKYKDMEFEGQTEKGGYLANLNITWSDLEGNYQGEGTSTPMAGQGLAYYTTYKGVAMFDPSINNAYGKLIGDVPLRIRGTLSKSYDYSWGKSTLGLIYRFDSGQHFSYTRSIQPSLLNPALAATQFGASATQYLNNTRGAGVTNANAFVDLAYTQDFKVVKVWSLPLAIFAKVNIQNVFNHQQVGGIPGTNAPGYNFVSAPSLKKGGSLASPWIPAANWGQAVNSGAFAAARTIFLSAGVKF